MTQSSSPFEPNTNHTDPSDEAMAALLAETAQVRELPLPESLLPLHTDEA